MLSRLRYAARPIARRAAYPAIEALWTVALRRAAPALAGGARPRAWASPGHQRVLIVGAHPDDETMGCGGVALLHKQAGDEVGVILVTDGGQARGPGLPQREVIALRAAEAEAAAAVLGLDFLQQWGLREMAWQLDDAAGRLRALLDSWQPDLVYAHSLVDYHPDHRRVAAALALALRKSITQPTLRGYEVNVPLGLLANVVAPLEAVGAGKAAAIAAYPSQRDIALVDRRRTRYNAALFALAGPAEVFWELAAPDYARLMARAPGPMYRSLRERPLTDPLAYLDFGRRRNLRAKVDPAA